MNKNVMISNSLHQSHNQESARDSRNPNFHVFFTRTRHFTFLLPCIVIDFFLNNQPDALIIPILFCYKTLHVSGIFSALRSFLLYIRHWYVSCRFLMTASKQGEDGRQFHPHSAVQYAGSHPAYCTAVYRE